MTEVQSPDLTYTDSGSDSAEQIYIKPESRGTSNQGSPKAMVLEYDKEDIP